MAVEQMTIDPVFDPYEAGETLDILQEELPVRRQKFSGTLFGDFLSRRKGEGYDPDGLREYEMGDDVRHIDHRASAQMVDETLLVREHYRDNQPKLLVFTDAFQRRYEGNPGNYSARDLALSAVLGLVSMAHRLEIPTQVTAANHHGVVFEQRRPGRGRRNNLQLASGLAECALSASEAPQQSYRLADLLREADAASSESLVAVVSSFRDTPDPADAEMGWLEPLQELRNRDNQIVAVEVTNPWDMALPDEIDRFDIGGEVVWVGDDKKGRANRARYIAAALRQSAAITEALDNVQAHHITLNTSDPRWVSSFQDQLRTGRHRR